MKSVWRVAAVLLALTAAAGQAVAAEVIQSLDSDVRVAKNGDLTVGESVRVHAEGKAMRHGIYRDFPLAFRDGGGRLREVTFRLLGVFRDGRREPYRTERAHGFIRIYAGDPNVLISPGEHVYKFVYLTGRQVRWLAGKPELNWNATGNFWKFPIETATYRLHLLDGAAPLRFTAYTGPLGARGTDWRGSIDAGGTLVVSTTRALAPGEGLTVVAALPEGAVDPPDAGTLWSYALSDYRQWVIAGIGFLGVLIYYLAAWALLGRDPRPGVVIPLFHPPQGVSPALANYVYNWGFAGGMWRRAFTAAALSLAVRGLIAFDRSGGALTLKATGNDGAASAPLPAEERAILTALSANDGTIVIDNKHTIAVGDLSAKFTAAVTSGNVDRFFRRNREFVLVGSVLSVAVLTVLVGGWQDADILALPLALLAFLVLNGVFFYLMEAPTALGRPIMDQLAGLRLYLETAESDRLNANAPEITPDRFEALLPYAVALGVERPWANAFAAALDRASPPRRYEPSWDGSGWSGGGGWSGGNLGDAVGAAVDNVGGAMAAAAVPVFSGASGFSGGDSGGGGGGGGSGGGGGGGGGGGW